MQPGAQIPYVPPQPEPHAPSVLYPPWMDPLYLLRTTKSITTRMQCDATGLLRIGANPARWSITICMGSGSATARISIHRTSATGGYGIALMTNSVAGGVVTLTLFTHGSDVPSELYVRAGNLEFLEVTERIIYSDLGERDGEEADGAGRLPMEDTASAVGSGDGRDNGAGGEGGQGTLQPDSVGAMGGVGGAGYDGGDSRGGGKQRPRPRNPKPGGA